MQLGKAFALISLLGLALSLRASASCTNATLQGNYGFVLTGVNSSFFLTAVLGQITADGAGSLTGSETTSNNGVIDLNLTITGSYAVGSNCRGTAAITPAGNSTSNYSLVIDSTTKQIEMIETDAGWTVSGYALAQGNAICTLAGVKSTYGYHGFGWNTNPTLTPVAVEGQVQGDGLGHLTGTQTAGVGGVIVSGRISGTYTVNSNCTGTTTTTVGGTTSHTNVVLVNSGRTVLQMGTDTGAVAINVGQKQ